MKKDKIIEGTKVISFKTKTKIKLIMME